MPGLRSFPPSHFGRWIYNGCSRPRPGAGFNVSMRGVSRSGTKRCSIQAADLVPVTEFRVGNVVPQRLAWITAELNRDVGQPTPDLVYEVGHRIAIGKGANISDHQIGARVRVLPGEVQD